MRSSCTKTLTLAVAALAIGATPLAGAQSAEVAMYGDEVAFTPMVSGHAQSLSVSCAGGFRLDREYGANDLVAFSPRTADGAFPVQDSCKYTLRVHPAPDPRLAEAQAAGDDAVVEMLSQLEAENTHVIIGSFQINQSQFVSAGAPALDVE